MSAKFKQWTVAAATLLAVLPSVAPWMQFGPCQIYNGDHSDRPGMKVAHCSMVHNLTILTKVLDGLPNDIQGLYIPGGSISRLTENQFNYCRHLQEISISKNQINQIEKGAFRYMTNVTYIDLGENKITELPSDCFTYTPNITKVWLESNKIKRLQSNLFSNLKFLKRVELARNEIASIEEHCFANVPQLEEISLTTNKLVTLGKNFIQDFPISLKRLYLDDNPWHCDACLCGVVNITVFGNLWLGVPSRAPTCATPLPWANRTWTEARQTGLCPDLPQTAHPGPCRVDRGPTDSLAGAANKGSSVSRGLTWKMALCADRLWFPPALTSSTTSAAEGSDLQLQCQHCAPARLVWTFNDVKLPSNFVNVSTESLTSTLTVRNIQIEQQGYYLCRVKNCEECEDAGVYVTVKGDARRDFNVKQRHTRWRIQVDEVISPP